MRILILSHYYPPEIGAAAARLHGLARWLVSFGHQVTVVTGFPNYPSGLIPESYRGKTRLREVMDGVAVQRTWVYASSHRGTARRLANYFSFVFSSIIVGSADRSRYDVVLVSSPPLFLGLAGYIVSRVKRVPFVFDVRDIWPEVAVEAGEFDRGSFPVRLAERLEQFIYRKASHVTVVTEAKRTRLLAKGVAPERLSNVPNGVDLDRLRPRPVSKFRTTLGLERKFVAIYAGLIGVAQGLGILLDAAEILIKNEALQLVVVGDGVRKADLIADAEARQLSNVSFVPPQPREVIPGMLGASDVAVVPLLNAEIADAVPSKLLEAWACGLPVIFVGGGEAGRLVEEVDGGIVVKPGEPESLARALLTLAKDERARHTFAGNGLRYVSQHLDRPLLARRMESVLEKVAAGDQRQEQP